MDLLRVSFLVVSSKRLQLCMLLAITINAQAWQPCHPPSHPLASHIAGSAAALPHGVTYKNIYIEFANVSLIRADIFFAHVCMNAYQCGCVSV